MSLFDRRTLMQIPRISVFHLVAVAVLLLFSACGSSSTSDSPTPVATTSISGSVVAAPVSGAAVVVKNADGYVIAGPVNTASDGTYTVNVPTSACNADLRIESSNGTFLDEATGTTTTAGILAAYVSAGSVTTWSSVNIDPSSTIIHNLVTTGSKTFGEALTIFNSAFAFTPDISVASRNTPSTGASAAQRLAGLRTSAFSQLTKDLGLTPDKQSDLLAAIEQDLADDGKLNGSTGSLNGTSIPEDMQNRFEHALVTMLSDTVHNMTGLTADQIGSLPCGQVILTNTYRVQYLPGMMAATQGKSSFKIKITKRSDGSPATGLTISLMPMMHMASMGHATPVDAVTEEASTGIYDCTVYYLMASGPGIGFWDLKVMISSGMGMGMSETATFYPVVGMAMGTDTVRATLYGADDVVSSMSGTQYNKYYLFSDGPITAAAPTVDLFITHAEMMNMSYKLVSPGAVLSSPTGTVTTMTVQASLDNSTWLTATNSATGHWSVSGLTGLVSGQTTTVYIQLNVNGQDKTTNGNAASGNNSAMFIVTPQ